MNRFFVDAETDGLYGGFLSTAALVTDESGTQTDRFYGAVRVKEEDIRSQWVIENVYPYLNNADRFFDSEADLLAAFWEFWLKYRDSSVCIAYVQYPVEANLFRKCVEVNMSERALLAPFPIYDLSTLLIAKGYDFNADLQQLTGLELVSHDAMNDVLLTAKAWQMLK